MEGKRLSVQAALKKYWPAFLVVVLIVGFLMSSNQKRILAVAIDGEVVGYAEKKEDVEAIIEGLLADAKSSFGEEVKIVQEIKYNKVKSNNEEVITPEQWKEILAEKLDFLGMAYQLSVEGKPVVWVKKQEDAELLIEKIKEITRERLEKDENVTVEEIEIKERIDGKSGLCSLQKIKSVDEAAEIMLNGGIELRKHLVEQGDSLWSIARKYNLTVEDLKKANSELKDDRLSIGQELNLELPAPYLTILTTERALVRKEIPYSTKEEKDANLWAGQKKVKQKGVPGLTELAMLIKRENGNIKEETILGQKVVREPTTEIVSRGTKSLPSRGGGTFIWPVQGSITSPYGSRGGRMHQGIDIGAKAGTPVKAAGSGVVTEAGWRNGYGYTVIINHGGGITTLYGHNSKLLVSAGDTVSKGQVIAYVGSTGSSTGPHLHFEVRSGGRAVNPLNYFN
ncbi:MAG TPA: peptidoglycan DD-metalloendopeptidase family protein [Clostridia bacterium]|nr:peptidoglycan DD-metalloendopeptidase family protein [Clostridia bacterium]